MTLRFLFFLSGAAGLIYEVVWTRLLADVVGSTALAMSGVFSVFLGSLALGAVLFGRFDVRGSRALWLYGTLELGIGLLAATASAVLVAGDAWLLALAPPAGAPLALQLAFSLGASAVLLAPATVLMGGTLPVLLGAVPRRDVLRRESTQLYGWNTLGAGMGVLLAGFVLIWQLGITGTVGVAVAVNVVVGSLALLLARGWAAGGAEVDPASDVATEAELSGAGAGDDLSDATAGALWTWLAAVSGFAVLALEILWGRMGRFFIGDRTLAVSTVLFVFITALGAAALAAEPLARRAGVRRPRGTVLMCATVFLAGGVLHLLHAPAAAALSSGESLAEVLSGGFLVRVTVFTVLAWPPIFLLGLVFPLLLRNARQLTEHPGPTVGRLYGVNTAAAVAGAVVAGFLLSRWTGTLWGFYAVALGLVVTGAVLTWRLSSARPARTLVAGALVAALGAAAFFPGSLARIRSDETLLESNEDEYGVQVMVRTDEGNVRVRNNRLSLVFDLGDPQTTHAQQMAAHLTALLARNADSVLNVGTGYGITAGTYTLYRGVESVETVEILPFLLERQPLFSDFNFEYYRDPRVKLVQGDGRRYVAASNGRWDVISVNVLDPYLPGSSSLYTVDFWRLARSRLSPGGVYTQLFWGSDLDLLVKGIGEVFPTVWYFPAYGGTSYNVVAFRDSVDRQDLLLHMERLTAKAESEIRRITGAPAGVAFQRAVREAWRLTPELEALAASASGPLHTDDHPVLEYRWAHGARGVSIFDSPQVLY